MPDWVFARPCRLFAHGFAQPCPSKSGAFCANPAAGGSWGTRSLPEQGSGKPAGNWLERRWHQCLVAPQGSGRQRPPSAPGPGSQLGRCLRGLHDRDCPLGRRSIAPSARLRRIQTTITGRSIKHINVRPVFCMSMMFKSFENYRLKVFAACG